MRNLARTFFSLLLALSLCAPATAQIVGRRDYGPASSADPFLPDSRLAGAPVADEIRQIHRRIDRLRDSGMLSRREARGLRREARLIGHAAYRYSAGGLSGSEQAELQARTAVLRDKVNRPRR